MPSSEPAGLEESVEELYEEAPCGYLSLRADGTIVRANRTFLRSTGHTADELAGRRLQDLLTTGSKLFHATHWGPLLELAGRVSEIPADLVRADGSHLPVLLNATLQRDAEGRAVAIRASLFDATDRRRYERELIAARDQQAAVARLGAHALEGAAPAALLVEAARVMRELAGADQVAIVEREEGGLRLAAASGWPDAELADGGRWVAELHAPLLAGKSSGARQDPGPGGRGTLGVVVGPPERPFAVLGLHRASRPFSPGDQAFATGVANVLWSAIERRRAEEETEHRALHDPLTRLPNRLLLHRRIVDEIARSRAGGGGFAVCLLDLDDFKLVNDSLGHFAGDELLRTVAGRLSGAVRHADLVVRLGGDEFVILCGDVLSTGGAEGLADRVAASLRAPFALEGREHVVSASLGVVVGDAASTPEGILRDADVAMYHAKAGGQGRRAHFDASMRERARTRLRVEAELRQALRLGELRVVYQPIVTAAERRVVDFEALVRWAHPERGLLAPGEFVAVAEESGLIVEVGREVLEAACYQLVDWRARGVLAEDVGVTVNVSARQLASAGFPAEVAAALERSGLDRTPGRLGLEITETVLMESGASEAVLSELAALGVGLLLDDFGTGASSLARLKRFPVDTLKVDRAFVSGLGEGPGEDDAIVAAIMGMAGALGLRVVAEGVENERQLARLRELGCEFVQGYLISRPVAAEGVPEL